MPRDALVPGTRGLRIAAVLVFAIAAACTELRPGTDINDVLPDSGGRGPADGSSAGDAAGGDASSRDAAGADASARDGDGGDAGIDDAGDSGVPECVPDFGRACARAGFCGATYDCSGDCVGGVGPPPCTCSAPACQLDSNLWSSCSDPADLGDPCGCGGSIDCGGACAGSTPLPTCECGTPTCSGCVGGSCAENSTCTQGQCLCTVEECTVGGATSCSQGAIYTCSVDAYGCGRLTSPQACQYGCVEGAPACNSCHPSTGQACEVECTCEPCNAGSVAPGNWQCDGTCAVTGACTCVNVCCGLFECARRPGDGSDPPDL